MPSISALSSSRGDNTAVLRAANSNRNDDKRVDSSEKAANEPKAKKDNELELKDAEPGKRVDDVRREYSEVSRQPASALGDSGSQAEIEALGAKFDSFADHTSQRFDDVDSQLNDLANQLGDQLDSVVNDLSTSIIELQAIVKQGQNSSGPPARDVVNELKKVFDQQFSDLKAQHESETNALLANLTEVTEQLKTLSERSAEQISVLKDQFGGLGGQLETIIGKLDLLGKGHNLSLRSIGLFDVAAKTGNGALDKLIGIIGQNSTGNQLRSVRSRLQSVLSHFGARQLAAGLNLLA